MSEHATDSAHVLLTEATLAGLSVSNDAGRLVVRGPKSASELATRLLQYKDRILAALAGDQRRDEGMVVPPRHGGAIDLAALEPVETPGDRNGTQKGAVINLAGPALVELPRDRNGIPHEPDDTRPVYVLFAGGRVEKVNTKNRIPKDAIYWCREGDQRWTPIRQE